MSPTEEIARIEVVSRRLLWWPLIIVVVCIALVARFSGRIGLTISVVAGVVVVLIFAVYRRRLEVRRAALIAGHPTESGPHDEPR